VYVVSLVNVPHPFTNEYCACSCSVVLLGLTDVECRGGYIVWVT
jgi:hypothetical protein